MSGRVGPSLSVDEITFYLGECYQRATKNSIDFTPKEPDHTTEYHQQYVVHHHYHHHDTYNWWPWLWFPTPQAPQPTSKTKEDREFETKMYAIIIGVGCIFLGAIAVGSLIKKVVENYQDKCNVESKLAQTEKVIEFCENHNPQNTVFGNVSIVAKDQKNVDTADLARATKVFNQNLSYLISALVGCIGGGSALLVGGLVVSLNGLMAVGTIVVVAGAAFALFTCSFHWNDNNENQKIENDLDTEKTIIRSNTYTLLTTDKLQEIKDALNTSSSTVQRGGYTFPADYFPDLRQNL
jgi:hypothetical protein